MKKLLFIGILFALLSSCGGEQATQEEPEAPEAEAPLEELPEKMPDTDAATQQVDSLTEEIEESAKELDESLEDL